MQKVIDDGEQVDRRWKEGMAERTARPSRGMGCSVCGPSGTGSGLEDVERAPGLQFKRPTSTIREPFFGGITRDQSKLTSIKSPITKGQPSLGARHSFGSSKSNSRPNVRKCANRLLRCPSMLRGK